MTPTLRSSTGENNQPTYYDEMTEKSVSEKNARTGTEAAIGVVGTGELGKVVHTAPGPDGYYLPVAIVTAWGVWIRSDDFKTWTAYHHADDRN